MKYKVHETYTPDDPDADRSRRDAAFESDSTDLVELAFLARKACYLREIDPETENSIRAILNESDATGQLEDQDANGFEFILFSNCGEWCLEVEAEG